MSSTNHINLCLPSTGTEDDWKNLYEASFPQDERMSVTEVRSLLASNHMLLHKTTDTQSGLLCFSLVTILSNNVLLAYIATDQTKRSSGVGSKHMKHLIDLLKKLYPAYLGLFLEIESTKEKNLSVDEDKARKRRLAFYQRLHCKRMLHKEYLLPSYTPATPARQGELLWSEFAGSVDDTVLKAVIHEIYTRAYGLNTSDPSYVKVLGQFTAAAPTANPVATSPVVPSPATTIPAAPSTVAPAGSSGPSTAPAVTPVNVADAAQAPNEGTSGPTGGASKTVSPETSRPTNPVATPVVSPTVSPTVSPAAPAAAPAKDAVRGPKS
jgi:hypothetical protein